MEVPLTDDDRRSLVVSINPHNHRRSFSPALYNIAASSPHTFDAISFRVSFPFHGPRRRRKPSERASGPSTRRLMAACGALPKCLYTLFRKNILLLPMFYTYLCVYTVRRIKRNLDATDVNIFFKLDFSVSFWSWFLENDV